MHDGSTRRADVVALYVDARGSYPSTVEEWWDESRDARKYTGDLPVVAHPPCTRWCRLAGLVEARWGYKRGEDGGCFAAALATVRRVGGVIEHPAYSDAWAAYGLPRPPTGGGWVDGAIPGEEWTCYVEQWRYGHLAKKATWLYYVGIERPPELKWGHLADSKNLSHQVGGMRHPTALVSWCGNHVSTGERRKRLSKKQVIHTPPEFQAMLLDLAAYAVVRA